MSAELVWIECTTGSFCFRINVVVNRKSHLTPTINLQHEPGSAVVRFALFTQALGAHLNLSVLRYVADKVYDNFHLNAMRYTTSATRSFHLSVTLKYEQLQSENNFGK